LWIQRLVSEFTHLLLFLVMTPRNYPDFHWSVAASDDEAFNTIVGQLPDDPLFEWPWSMVGMACLRVLALGL
jgi:hypothetical protein